MLAQLGAEEVADPSHGANRRAAPAQFFAQVADVNVERSIQGRRRPLVDRRGQLIARDDPARPSERSNPGCRIRWWSVPLPAHPTKPRACLARA